MKITVKILITIILGFSLNSCDSLLDEKSYDFNGYDQIGNSEKDANLWVNGCLGTLNSGSFFRWGAYDAILELDNDYVTGAVWAFGTIGAGNFSADPMFPTSWNGPYTLIHNCNVAIAQIEKMTFEETARKNALGKVYFLKAWSYFQLVQSFGAVPIFKKGISGGDDVNQEAKPVMEVYNYIIENLKEAEKCMYAASANTTGNLTSDAAKALLAKVYVTIASGALKSGNVIVKGGPATQTIGGVAVNIAKPVALTHSKSVVAGLENVDAQVYFKLARDKAKELIDKSYFGLVSYDDLWKLNNYNSKERIWNLQSNKTNPNLSNKIAFTYRGYGDQDISGTGLQGGWYGIREHWYELFEDKDYRITKGVLHKWYTYGNWAYYPKKDSEKVKNKQEINSDIKTSYKGDEIWISWSNLGKLRKFEQTDIKEIWGDYNWPLLRFADVVLIYAEAENEVNGGPNANAIKALNDVRERSKASYFPTAGETNNLVGLRSAILEERAKEFAGEGIRRWDLIRWGIYLQVMNAIGTDEQNILKSRQKRHLLFPIPTAEINANKLIKQNLDW